MQYSFTTNRQYTPHRVRVLPQLFCFSFPCLDFGRFVKLYRVRWHRHVVLIHLINLDGVVNGSDLTRVLSAWGACGGCPEDLDGNGVVDGSDLTVLLSNWS